MHLGFWSPKKPLGCFIRVIPCRKENGTVNGTKDENPLSPVGLILTHTQLTIWQPRLVFLGSRACGA